MKENEMNFDNPEYVKIFREIIQEDIERFHKGKRLDHYEENAFKAMQRYYPDDIKKQVDLYLCISESIIRSENLGYEKGSVPKDLLNKLTKKYNVEGVFTIEIINLQATKPTGIIEEGN